MMFLSVVPGIGAALIWIPACLYLAASGQVAFAAGLAVFCGLLVGSVDNILRPKLVGSDTQLHELMIFFSTLGGLLTFGLSGFIIGPIIAALFVTVWEIYGVEFRPWLPKTGFIPHGGTDLPGYVENDQADPPDSNHNPAWSPVSAEAATDDNAAVAAPQTQQVPSGDPTQDPDKYT